MDTLIVTLSDDSGHSATSRVAFQVVATVVANNDSTFGIPWNSAITYGTLLDTRDGQSYRTVQIGSQVWMAQNLNYAGTGTTVGTCFNNSNDSCAKYGRLYTWTEAMAGASSSSTTPSGIQGVCPSEWHVPSDDEWTTIQTFVNPSNTITGSKLKSTSGWLPDEVGPGNGTDYYGFRALPGGVRTDMGAFKSVDSVGFWWSTTVMSGSTNGAYSRAIYNDENLDAALYVSQNDIRNQGYSVRCISN